MPHLGNVFMKSINATAVYFEEKTSKQVNFANGISSKLTNHKVQQTTQIWNGEDRRRESGGV